MPLAKLACAPTLIILWVIANDWVMANDLDDLIYIYVRYDPGEPSLPGVVTGTGLRRGSVPGR